MTKPNMKLRGLRVEKGLTQDDIAKKLGMTRQSYTQKELGKRDFTSSEMIEISEILDTPPSSIFFTK